jgi:zinc protease
MRSNLQSAVSGAATRRTVSLAESLAGTVERNTVFTAPADDLALFDSIVKDLKIEEVNGTFGTVLGGAGPLVQLIAPKVPEGGEAALRAEFEKAVAAPIAATEAKATVPWPYTSFGTPGTVAERQEITDLGLVKVRFLNNVRLIVKPTKFSDDQVLVSASIGNGALALPLDKPSAAWAANAFLAGGLKAMSQEDIVKAFNGVVATYNFSVGDQAFLLSGSTRPADLLMQLQLLAASASEPGFRPEGFAQAKATALAALPQLGATPDGVLSRDLGAILRSDDPRWRTPTREEIEATAPDALQQLLTPSLAAGPLDVTIVGNVTVDEAIRLVAQTFGALPARTLTPPPAAGLAIHFPEALAAPILRNHKGRADQAIALAAWPTTDFLTDTTHARALILAGDILQSRVREEIRVAEGATYSPVGIVDQSTTFPGFGFAYSYVETPPAKVESFFAHIEKITNDMKTNGVTMDELVRAKAPNIERMKKEVLSNEYWLRALTGSLTDPRIIDSIRDRVKQYEQLTPADVQTAAATFLAGHKPLRMIVLPESASKS